MSRNFGRGSRPGNNRGHSSKSNSMSRQKERRNFEREAIARAEERFSVKPKPMGFPKEEMTPNKINLKWKESGCRPFCKTRHEVTINCYIDVSAKNNKLFRNGF